MKSKFKNWIKKTNDRFSKTSKLVGIGLVAVIMLYVSAAGMISVTYPWFVNNNSDELAHVDMIYRIYNGDLPRATDGLRYKPFIELGGGNIYQRAAGHPPLYHLIMAPFMGPLLNRGKWRQAIAVGRAINIIFGILCILALSWAGWLMGGKRKSLLAVAVPALAVMIYRFTRINTDLSMDGLLTLWSTLALINLFKILKHGPRTKYLLYLTLLLSAGMATKISFAILLVLGLGVVVWAYYWSEKGKKSKNFMKGSIISLVILGIVIAASGWYYYFWNYKSSGSFTSPLHVSDLFGQNDRIHRTYKQILTSSDLWALLYARITAYTVVSTVITTLAVSGYFAMQKVSLLKVKLDKLTWQVITLMSLTFLGIFMTQIKLAHPSGSVNFRYLLPALLPIGLFLAYGLLAFRWLRGQLVVFATVSMAWTTILSIKLGQLDDGLIPGVSEWGKEIHKLYILVANNGIPSYIVASLFLMFALGSVLLSVSLFSLSKITEH